AGPLSSVPASSYASPSNRSTIISAIVVSSLWPGFKPDNAPDYARPRTLEPAALRANYRRGRWFESTAAHHGFRNANRGRGKAERRDDAVAALHPHLDDQLFEQRLALTRSAVEHCISDCFFRAAHSFFAWRLIGGRRVTQFMKLR